MPKIGPYLKCLKEGERGLTKSALANGSQPPTHAGYVRTIGYGSRPILYGTMCKPCVRSNHSNWAKAMNYIL